MRKNNNKETFIVPPSIQLLFDNNQLELIKTLCLLFSLSKKRRQKYNKVSDIIFYYSIVNFDMLKILEEEESNEISRNFYYRFQENINQIILELLNLKFAEIKGGITSKTADLGIRLTNEGILFVDELEINYFSKLINEYLNVIELVSNDSKNKNLLKGVSK
ncbi:hypothetical protein M5E03_03710 [Bacillus safensis]|uniref:hypothetical protein n=1 Tax=Bacillus safensis TaxID=561879 RepID=UPI000B439ADB|nr:hypothetical protein [Bacillus safensis]MCK8453246.1 hypothetical protein [Bacillus safensis]MCY7492577.1 hypothetical protein [Bacillus safensis]MED4992713.1 hypothetical protein [Bacillus safensis]UDB46800.1 hypothetical protein B0X07_15545 [Bacillus safensis]USD79822.1 hypothetical protein M5E03_03710 [Bacillus safensis]